MNTQLFIENYEADITTEISALLNFAIDDIKDFSARSTTWSRTIVLPGTANNNKLFGHIFQVGQSNGYDSSIPNVNYNFNAAKSARVILFQDQIQTFKGVLRLLQININNGFQGACEYEVSVFGNLVGLNSVLSGRLLENLDFSAYDHVYNDANIVASWDNPGGTGVYYPLIDYGTYSTGKHDWDIRTFRPALYAREYIDKMITSAGYRYVMPLADTPRFKGQVIPQNKKYLTITTTDLASANITSAKNFVFPPAGTVIVAFDVNTGTGFTANPAKTIFTYAGTLVTNINLHFKFIGTFSAVGFFASVSLFVYKNGEAGTLLYNTFTIFSPFTIETTLAVSVAPGDTIEFRWAGEPAGTMQLTTAEFDIKTPTGVPVQISIGDTVKVNESIPQNIRQIDFLVSIVKLYNLYVYEDKFDETLIYITPYIDFYSHNTANSVDWTHKLNRNKVVKVKPMSELNAKIYKFKFKSDSDYYNDLYRKRYNEGYGDRIYDSEFEFTEQTKEFEIIFSSTPLVGYGAEQKIYSTIFKRTGSDAAPTEENTDSNIRILQTKKVTGVSSWNITTDSGATVLNTLTRYGYAGHLDDPAAPTNDLNFGATKELFFILSAGSLSDNQFNVYWSGYMREITDKDSKLVIGSFYLTAKDILNLDFSKYIYVDGIAFRLNAIKDYNATTPNDCVVELFKINTTSYSEATNPDGPPTGCYLLWSDEEILDYDDGEELLYGDCNTNPGDGGGPPPDTFYVNWSTFILHSGSFKIFINDVLMVSVTGNLFSSGTTDSGSFIATLDDVIKVRASGLVGASKRVFISNDVDGTMSDVTTTAATNEYIFTVEANKNYNAQGTIN